MGLIDLSAFIAGLSDNDARREVSFHAGGTTRIPDCKQISLGGITSENDCCSLLLEDFRGDACLRAYTARRCCA